MEDLSRGSTDKRSDHKPLPISIFSGGVGIIIIIIIIVVVVVF
jgi:hypothetical protein